MDNLEKMKQEKQYEEYVTQKTPKHNVWTNMLKAFLTGGIICTIGQAIYNYCELQNLSKDACSGWTSLLLILASVILTGMNLYPRIAKWGGAGALVPITGFANSVAAPAIEYKKEGQVFGIGCKIFTIAGPVILYGIVTSSVLGLLYWIGKITGVVYASPVIFSVPFTDVNIYRINAPYPPALPVFKEIQHCPHSSSERHAEYKCGNIAHNFQPPYKNREYI